MSDSNLSSGEKEALSDLIEGKLEEEGEGEQHQPGESIPGKFSFREPSHDFSQVVGMDGVKTQLLDKVERPVVEKERYSSYGLPGMVNGIALFGPPRVGKTYAAVGLAGETGFNLLQVNAADIKNSKVGETESNIRRVIEQGLRAQPCIILMNEFDVLASRRDENRSQAYKKDMVGTFLEEMEELTGEDTVIIGTSNHINRVDEAFTQPGRFSTGIYVGLPDQETRKALLEQALEDADDNKVEFESLDLERVAELTEGYTCGDLVDEGLVYEAKLVALKQDEPIQQKHLLYGFQETQTSVPDPSKYRMN